jgi:hypothetical protein
MAANSAASNQPRTSTVARINLTGCAINVMSTLTRRQVTTAAQSMAAVVAATNDREKYLLELLRKASVFIPASPLSMEIEAVLLKEVK